MLHERMHVVEKMIQEISMVLGRLEARIVQLENKQDPSYYQDCDRGLEGGKTGYKSTPYKGP